ncbi:tryptophanase leader peptide, partial [Escherichia coli]|nr:tryptophanase leader peptide [Escherichia coli]HCR5637272.1 tryptophanase leader peptide [Shigella flexneri]HCS1401070.1 tryptophanase leader peptide [Shigella boydii]EKT1166213.1 tryptophanase leader peptide [Escherichia coli]EKT1212242.1 tryptophanase leader peptide [Escherichia coli]
MNILHICVTSKWF